MLPSERDMLFERGEGKGYELYARLVDTNLSEIRPPPVYLVSHERISFAYHQGAYAYVLCGSKLVSQGYIWDFCGARDGTGGARALQAGRTLAPNHPGRRCAYNLRAVS